MSQTEFEFLIDAELELQRESNARMLATLRAYDAQQTSSTSGADLILAKQQAPPRRSTRRRAVAVAA